jgi:dTDP-4-amino-4,6-dideoxygalactose transaminase
MKIAYFDLSQFYKAHADKINELTFDFYNSGQYFSPVIIANFEKNLSEYVSRKFAITVGSCTDALYFSLRALGVKPNDEVILPSVSFIATLSPVLRAGAVPIFSDIDEETGLIDFEHLQSLINPKVKAIILVDLYGNMNDPDRISELYKKYQIPVIVDAAQSMGSSFNGVRAGNPGTISCFSFDPTKVIHAFGTGGAVLTDDPEIADKIGRLRYHGRKENDYVMTAYNSRMNSLQAALLNYQLGFVDEIIKNRKLTADKFIETIRGLKNISWVKIPGNCNSNFHKFVITSPDRDFIKSQLEIEGIQTHIHYPRPLFDYGLVKTNNTGAVMNGHAENFTRKVLSLPVHTYMNETQISYICDKLKETDSKFKL